MMPAVELIINQSRPTDTVWIMRLKNSRNSGSIQLVYFLKAAMAPLACSLKISLPLTAARSINN